ncbi:MAG: gas vesicle protein [Desulfobacterales bacterium CG07_land_8_20_14_0_80_52_14]|nr:MAG: gas vesicle protein [Desulfobacterales bacterium CG07_land_8_20_14_0_80_52_14]
MAIQQHARHSLESTNLADLLERILDKGIVIAGDIKVSIGDVELLTVQIRLVICSVDKAKEMGMDWWVNNPAFCSRSKKQQALPEAMDRLEERLARIETSLAAGAK